MKTYPLQSMSLKEAKEKQFQLIDCVTEEFHGREILTRGDLGVAGERNKPLTTWKVERVLRDFFQTEACMLVRGSGSGAIRLSLHAMMSPGDALLVHKAPVYPTTRISALQLGLQLVEADFNDLSDVKAVLRKKELKGVLIQHTRQIPGDSYELGAVIHEIKAEGKLPIITDDNYAVMKGPKIGAQLGADLSCFSSFKLLGPEGIGVIVGKACYIERLIEENYSGGMQVQGHEALDVLRGLIYAPVALAIQSEVSEECVERLRGGEVTGIKEAFLANAQSRVILAELEEEIAEEVLKKAEEFGAAPYPIGSESKYEFVPMFYRVSGTFRMLDESLQKRMIRINPMRSGADTVIRILKKSIESVKKCS